MLRKDSTQHANLDPQTQQHLIELEDSKIENLEDEVDFYKARKSVRGSVRVSMSLKLTERQILRQNKCWPTFKTILSYLVSEQSKKARSFQIGVFTIFLVVSFLTLLKSAVDVAQVAFVKIASDQVGISDFRFVGSAQNFESPLIDGNDNFL